MNTQKDISSEQFSVGQEVIWTDLDGDFGEVNREYLSVITGIREPELEQGYECLYLELYMGVRIEALDHEIKTLG